MNSRGILIYDGIYVNIIHGSKEVKETINMIIDEVVLSIKYYETVCLVGEPVNLVLPFSQCSACILKQLVKFDPKFTFLLRIHHGNRIFQFYVSYIMDSTVTLRGAYGVYHTGRNAKCDVKGQRLTLPSSSSCGVSTPWSGTRSPVKLLVCVNGRFTPLMCDIAAGPLCARSFFFAARASALPAAATASSIRKDGKSSSCCLSVEQQKVTWINALG
ncbi:hypothetical protein ALC62_15561 [Cyphomyrmex costatus]|uniref:Uncharacterized protein n=1 Tax=Cyphomyrmex costatus TaxID=456900 RepID=A0A195BYY0_9HYME|nr:hypothetical protein ALC62_15561 [Cyphomyrmex costatus]